MTDFYEDDEDPQAIRAAFDRGPHGVTGSSGGARIVCGSGFADGGFVESHKDCRAALDAAQDEIERLISEKETLRERLEWEQPEPDDDVIAVNDHTAPDNEQDGYTWGRTHKAGEGGPHSEWKGYKNGGKVYLDWPELVRRWGPITPTMWDKPCDGAYKSCPPGDHSHVGGVQAGGGS